MTTSEILEIPQIPVYDCGNLQNDLHIGFGTDNSKRLVSKGPRGILDAISTPCCPPGRPAPPGPACPSPGRQLPPG